MTIATTTTTTLHFACVLLTVVSFFVLLGQSEAGLTSNGAGVDFVMHSGSSPQRQYEKPFERQYEKPFEKTYEKPAQENPRENDMNKYAKFDINKPPLPFSGNLSAWGFIALIMFVVMIGMTIYYCIMCYPLLWGSESNTMGELISTSSGTPMQNAADFDDFEGKRNYSSRSTTPSKSHDDQHGIHNEVATLAYLQPPKQV